MITNLAERPAQRLIGISVVVEAKARNPKWGIQWMSRVRFNFKRERRQRAG